MTDHVVIIMWIAGSIIIINWDQLLLYYLVSKLYAAFVIDNVLLKNDAIQTHFGTNYYISYTGTCGSMFKKTIQNGICFYIISFYHLWLMMLK